MSIRVLKAPGLVHLHDMSKFEEGFAVSVGLGRGPWPEGLAWEMPMLC